MNTYGARVGSPFKVEHAQKIGEFIEKIPVKSTENILNAIAIKKKHLLYNYIEWDDVRAGHEYRLQQVRNIVNHVTIEITETGDSLPIRAFYSVIPKDDSEQKVYVDLQMCFSNEHYRNQVVDRAKHELDNWVERYKQYNELSKFVYAIKPLID